MYVSLYKLNLNIGQQLYASLCIDNVLITLLINFNFLSVRDTSSGIDFLFYCEQNVKIQFSFFFQKLSQIDIAKSTFIYYKVS